jgi:hypothetical protein
VTWRNARARELLRKIMRKKLTITSLRDKERAQIVRRKARRNRRRSKLPRSSITRNAQSTI